MHVKGVCMERRLGLLLLYSIRLGSTRRFVCC